MEKEIIVRITPEKAARCPFCGTATTIDFEPWLEEKRFRFLDWLEEAQAHDPHIVDVDRVLGKFAVVYAPIGAEAMRMAEVVA